MTLTYRDLTTLEEFAEVVELERQIWGPGYVEVVPVPILAVSVHRGGILIGAFDGDRMIGFVYSLPSIKDKKPTQWSHMAGVLADYRSAGLGRTLKVLQRERTLAMGLDLIEWTYDPLQAMNAHLNFAKLGVIVEEYAENIYGTSNSPLHQGNPTDRFVAEWWIRKPHVERRLAGGGPLTLRTSEVGDAPQDQSHGASRRVARIGRRRPVDRRAADAGGNSDGVHRDAGRRARARAGMAHLHARHLHYLLRSRLQGSGFLPRPRGAPRGVPAGA